MDSEIIVIGAGMAGLSCASRLADAGHQVLVLDKGRGPGGRMAARRAEIAGQVVSFDHGAQYFTARDAAFRDQVEAWERQGVVARWPAAGDDAWVGLPGMNGPIRALSQGLDVRWNTRALSLSHNGSLWQVALEEGTLSARTLLVAIPAEQASELIAPVSPQLAAIAGSVTSQPCWAVMSGFAERLPINADTLRDPDAPVSWASRNSAKPLRTGRECWVIHASPDRSRELLDLPNEEVGPKLLADFFAQAGIDAVAPIHLAAHRWLYAMPGSLDGEAARYDAEARIGMAGDYLHSPRVEGAFLSGLTLAKRVASAP